MQWIRQLNRAGGAAGADITVYQVQYGKASGLAVILQATFGDGGGAAAPAVAPVAAGADGVPVPAGAAPQVTAVAAPAGGDTRFTPDDGNNTIIIRGSTPVRQQTLQLLAAIDRPPVQVLIDVMLIEVTLNDATAMGVQAYLQSHDASFIATNGLTTAIARSAPGFNLVLGNGINPKLIIDELSQVTKVSVVSAPSVSAFENEEAQIKVVEQVPIVTQQVVSTQAGNPKPWQQRQVPDGNGRVHHPACRAQPTRRGGGGAGPAGADAADERGVMAAAGPAPVIALLDQMLAQAVEARATDLHFEPDAAGMTVRQRVDGMLRPVTQLPVPTGRAVVARLKILAGLNIAERRLAQDGPIRAPIAGRTFYLRLAILPMVDGEGAALRILAGRLSLPVLAGLGLQPGAEAGATAALAHSHGLILINGPTGSGKTTTLAAATAHVNDPRRKIISIEGPVEYHIPGISQVQVNPAIGLTFSAGLRAFMRADPDVLLVVTCAMPKRRR
jgi:hypothetical protein